MMPSRAIVGLLVLFLAGAEALRVPTTAPSMKLATPADACAAVPPSAVRAEPPCANAFFGGGGKGVPEGAKCIFRKNAPCNRNKCQVNKGPCNANHASK